MITTENKGNMMVGLDIGTSKIITIVGEVTPDNEIEIVGIGTYPSHGLKRGVVVNIDATVQAIKRSVKEAELMAGCQIHSVFVGVAGSHVQGINSHGIVAIKEKSVIQADIDRVLDAAQAMAIPADKKILHIIPQEFAIDSQEGVKDPLGMSGVRLEGKVHLVSCSVNAVQNIETCLHQSGLDVEGMILEQLASSASILSEDEKELGVCLVDIGGGTSDIAIFTGGAIRYTSVIPIAGDQVTNDIAVVLRIASQVAEDIKVRYACARSESVNDHEEITLPQIAGKKGKILDRRLLAQVVQSRYEELFSLIRGEIRRSGFEDLIPAGIVFTGGTMKMEGALQLAENYFDRIPVRLGVPENVLGFQDIVQSPIYATSVGLMQFGLSMRHKGFVVAPHHGNGTLVGGKNLMLKVKKWFKENF